jgi:hypothetical protein
MSNTSQSADIIRTRGHANKTNSKLRASVTVSRFLGSSRQYKTNTLHS